ncbi:bifunctional helix-turn-helix transcriptional regulator/GNAT family N-acetyltransferase [Janthinobacterium lividum]|uniref:bifunctional helix-turn-helix transcriptional regulator/GNAT family N-acetyltransferase n=1 Tax=Janthinobacterium lividum TaxID=29581 RepID=UPI00087380F7|nr:bifunctional helix-turn-helix transcriptional regulator/GNAT family N-acetyltransferase [Janthinobacterium lividum]MCC7716198.1 MarR family transcriptional regulator [Janthinobacterium lividum]OEZ53084.1 acetyltransferase [Janthinobacterium lividum]WQE28868.1 bifunctional helix-turn-helix transcriptional regulator/GNAT family N-acetyltransferase [Janthinobacterium lividum]STQ94328.1 acetyltransferase [Janthinobacterium lividum]
MHTDQLGERTEIVRRFNRFYTRQIGVLHEHLLDSAFSLTEVRILYELAHREQLTSADLCRELGLNAGYLSRVIAGFEKQGLIAKTRSPTDARATQLQLTEQGQRTLAPLVHASRREVATMLERLPPTAQQELVAAMEQIQGLLGEPSPSYLLRNPQPGDMGWIIHRQAVLYAQEYGWNNEYEALVADILAKFVREFNPARERCWIAEKDGKVIGSVFIVRQDDTTAKLRLLYVDPCARGLGIGSRLVDECLRFSRQVGYTKMVLWTNSILTGARRIYDKAGFQLVEEETHHSFGKDLVGQVLARDL